MEKKKPRIDKQSFNCDHVGVNLFPSLPGHLEIGTIIVSFLPQKKKLMSNLSFINSTWRAVVKKYWKRGIKITKENVRRIPKRLLKGGCRLIFGRKSIPKKDLKYLQQAMSAKGVDAIEFCDGIGINVALNTLNYFGANGVSFTNCRKVAFLGSVKKSSGKKKHDPEVLSMAFPNVTTLQLPFERHNASPNEKFVDFALGFCENAPVDAIIASTYYQLHGCCHKENIAHIVITGRAQFNHQVDVCDFVNLETFEVTNDLRSYEWGPEVTEMPTYFNFKNNKKLRKLRMTASTQVYEMWMILQLPDVPVIEELALINFSDRSVNGVIEEISKCQKLKILEFGIYSSPKGTSMNGYLNTFLDLTVRLNQEKRLVKWMIKNVIRITWNHSQLFQKYEYDPRSEKLEVKVFWDPHRWQGLCLNGEKLQSIVKHLEIKEFNVPDGKDLIVVPRTYRLKEGKYDEGERVFLFCQ